MRSKPKKPEPPKPVARDVLKFESDDELSFGSGDESDNDEDVVIQPNATEEKVPDDKVQSSEDLIDFGDTAEPRDDPEINSNDGDRKELNNDMNGSTAENNHEEENGNGHQVILEEPSEDKSHGVSFDASVSFDEPAVTEQNGPKYEEETPRIDSLDDVLDDSDDDDVSSPEDNDEEDVITIRCKLLISDKYHPEYGLEELDPEELNVVDSLHSFEEGTKSKHDLCVDLIEALFWRDFENGEHWDIDPGTARELEEDEGGGGELDGRAFVVKKQARLDWNDLYSVAAAKGTIVAWPEKDEIRVENYSYYVAG
jgi:hypothetical protein